MSMGTRSEVKKFIKSGRVFVNGAPASGPEQKVTEEDNVELDGEKVSYEKYVYYMLNKPQGVVSATKDNTCRTVLSLITDSSKKDIFPVGRLDYNTSGALIMTNDGDLAYRLTHPKHEVYKTYRARVAGVLSAEKVSRLRKGVDIGGFVTSPAKVQVIKGGQRSTIVEISIHEGKNRQVRKMFAAVGNPVQELERVAIGEIHLGHLKPGHYCKLTRAEIDYLKNC